MAMYIDLFFNHPVKINENVNGMEKRIQRKKDHNKKISLSFTGHDCTVACKAELRN